MNRLGNQINRLRGISNNQVAPYQDLDV